MSKPDPNAPYCNVTPMPRVGLSRHRNAVWSVPILLFRFVWCAMFSPNSPRFVRSIGSFRTVESTLGYLPADEGDCFMPLSLLRISTDFRHKQEERHDDAEA